MRRERDEIQKLLNQVHKGLDGLFTRAILAKDSKLMDDIFLMLMSIRDADDLYQESLDDWEREKSLRSKDAR